MTTHETALVDEIASVHPDHARPRSAAADHAGQPGGTVAPPAGAVESRAPIARPGDSRPGDAGPADARPGPLPYGPFLQRGLPALSRAFRVLNRIYVLPVIKAGLGPLHANPLTGTWMLLRTTGRRTGRPREVALGYAFLDGNVYCSAGFGERTAWYRNLLADPRVEIVLPAGGFVGIAEPVTDPVELDRAWRALIRALGILGRSFVCRADAPPAELAAHTANLPLVRIRPVGLAGGPADPGGWAWVTVTAVGLAWLAGRWRRRDVPGDRRGDPQSDRRGGSG